MLTKVTAYNPGTSLDPLVLNITNRPETDLFEVRNIDGLGAVKADVNTTPKGSIRGETFVGNNVGSRNIVMTLGLDPDWNDWTVSRLRRLLDLYFMPETQIRFVFETMEFSPVEIFGYIEANDPNMFSKDPEHQISVICPDPDFVSVDNVFIAGRTDLDPIDVDYKGNLETGFNVLVRTDVAPNPSIISIYRTNPDLETFVVDNGGTMPLDLSHDFMMNSIPGAKFVKIVGASETNLLNKVTAGSPWLTLKPGINQFQVLANAGTHIWNLSYYEHFGSL